MFILALLLASVFAGIETSAGQKPKPSGRTPATTSVTGKYKNVINELEVLELPGHKVRIRFLGVYPNDHSKVETRNMGAFDETVTLNQHKATVKLQFGDEPCLIHIEFRATRAIVSTDGSGLGCGFGFNVEADGTYRKVSSKPPDLPPPDRN